MKRVHSDGPCASHWQLGPLSSRMPGPCGPHIGCKCACHTNGVEGLLTLLVKLDVAVEPIQKRVEMWWMMMPRHGETRDIY